MTGRPRKLPSVPKRPKPSQQGKKHLNGLIDEALEETFPASDAPAMLEPAPDSPRTNRDSQKIGSVTRTKQRTAIPDGNINKE
jgi:hypothetical protein